jgi:hypothetical protein
MSVQKGVQIVQNYLEDGGAGLERRYGSEAATAAQDLVALLKARLQEESVYASLWDQFEAEPRQTADELTAALEALVEADPALSRRMEAFLEEYHRVVSGAASEEEDSEIQDADAGRRGGDAYQLLDSPGDYSDAGTYLYGNLRPGAGSASEAAEAEVLSEGGVDVEIAAPDVSQVAALFEELYALVDGYEGASLSVKRDLRTELEQLEMDVAGGEEEYEEFISNRLCAVERLDPGVYRLVIEKLAGPEADFAPVVQQVAGRMLDIDRADRL